MLQSSFDKKITKYILSLLCFITCNYSYSQYDALGKFTVVLDAGHGGKDPGKVYGGVKEKDLALKIVLFLGKELEKQDDIRVVYTRKKDTFIDLFKRGQIANKEHADLFVSVHCNAHNSKAYGSETFVLGLHANEENFKVAKAENEVIYLEDNHTTNYEGFDINSPESVIGLTITQEEFLRQSVKLASLIQENFKRKAKRYNRGVKQAGFIVLHQTFMPSVLIEAGFVTNPTERRFLKSVYGQQTIASNIADAVLKYKKYYPYKPALAVKRDLLNINEEKLNEVKKKRDKNFVTFKIQLVVSGRKVELKPYNFRGLFPLTIENYKKMYRYYYGNTNDYQIALSLKQKAIDKGYEDCYIVAFQGGEKIEVSKALSIINK